jgi:hypothetical protein
MALIDKINDGFITITNLLKGKVNKTDVIAVAQGGTGGTDAATARSNLGLGTAAVYNITTSNNDATANSILKVGDFGLGSAGGVSSNYPFRDFPLSQIRKNFFTSFSNGEVFKYGSGLILSSLSTYRVTGIITDDITGDIYHVWLDNPQAANNADRRIIYSKIYTSNNTKNENVKFLSASSGSASYAKGWRKLTTTLPSQAGEITVAHGVTTVETVQAKVINSDGVIIYNNDIDPANQFYVRVNGANLILGVTANSTKIFGQPVIIYVGEEL